MRDSEVVDSFRHLFDVREFRSIHSLDREIEVAEPDAVLFEFDFPTKPALETLRNTKQKHSGIPVLMVTVQHSEALAVWAFRARVWDYLVKPIAGHDFERCMAGLMEMLELRAAQVESRKAAAHSTLIPEDNRWRGVRGKATTVLAPAIEFVENHFKEKISSAEVARLCNLTTFQLSRVFRETYNITFQDYIMRFRIREACRHLRNPTADVGDVGCLVGFNDPSYFGKVFRRYMHCSPSQFQAGEHEELVGDLLMQLSSQTGTSSNKGN